MTEYEAVRGQAPMGVLFLIIGILYLIFSIIGIAQYVMQAIALNDLGKRRNVKSSWLAWIPVTGFSTWVTGCIADEYDARNGMKRKWRVVLLSFLLSVVVLSMVGRSVIVIGEILAEVQGETHGDAAIIVLLIIGYILFAASLAAAVAYIICQYICLFKIFESTVPEKALKYFLLSILVPLAYPICLLKCRNKGYSVPEQVQQTPVYEQVQAESESGEVENNNQENTQDGE